MAVTGVTRVGHEHFVAGINQGQTSQLQGGRGTRRDHNPMGGDLQAKARRVPVADAFAQGRQARGLGVLGLAIAHGFLGGLLNQRRCGEVRFANVEKNHRLVRLGDLLCQGRGRFGDLHHVERLNALSALRDLHAPVERSA